MTAADTGAALLRRVCLDPDDVGARLVYADWLEQEAGDAERAEFIRVQCEHASWRAAKAESSLSTSGIIQHGLLRRRERELLDGLYGLGLEMLPAIDGLTRSNFVGGGGYGWFPREVSPAPGIEATFRRGFVEAVACPLTLWERHGPALVLAQPVLSVRLVGREPLWVGIPQGYYHEKPWTWLGPGAANDPRPKYRTASLPQAIYDLCNGWHPTEQDALDALSRACVAWARRKAGLDVRCRWCVSPTGGEVSPLYGPCPKCRGAGWVAAR